jgi:hypothetical protein
VADDTLVGIEVYQDHRPVTKETHLGNNRASQWHDHRPCPDTLKGQAILCHGRNPLVTFHRSPGQKEGHPRRSQHPSNVTLMERFTRAARQAQR